MHLPPVPRFLVRWTIRSVLAVLFVGVPLAVFYLREVGVGFGLKDRVAEALSGPAYQVAIGRLSLDPFRGLVAEGVDVRDRKNARRDLAHIETLVVSVNFNDLLTRSLSIDHIELDETDVSIPLGPEHDGTRLNLAGVSAQIVFLPDQMRISYFEGTVEGVRVIASGLLQNPKAFHLEQRPPSPGKEKRNEIFDEVVRSLAALEYPGQAPEFRAEISGDLADLTSIRASPVSVRSGPIVAPKWRIEGLEADLEYADGGVTLRRLVVRGRDGDLNASAQWRNGAADFEVSSSLRPEAFRDLLPENSPARALEFHDAPRFEAFGRVHAGANFRFDVTGAVRFGRFSFRGVEFDAFSADFATRDGKVFARDARILAGGGEISADVLVAPEDFRMRITNTIAPTLLAPMLGKKEQEFLAMMEFRDPPYLEMELRGTKPDFAAISGTGSLRLGRTAMRGAWLDRADSKIEIANRAVIYRDLTIARGKGVGTGTFIYDFGGQQVVLKNIDSTMPPVDVMMWADPKIADAIRPYRFRQPPRVKANGMIHLKDPTQNDLNLAIDSEAGLDYDLLKRTLKFGKTRASVHVRGTKVNADVLSAKLMGGDVGVKAVISIDAKDPTFGADVNVRRVNFAQLTKLYFDYDDSEGEGSGQFKFTARMGQEEKMKGSGNIRIEDGHVFAIPLLGPLSDIINKIIPGAGFQTARLATADFTIADEKINTKNLAIEGAGFSLIGYGDIFFMKDDMDMSVRINARGIPGIVLFPVSKLFEYISTGSVSNPEWRPKIIPRFGGE